MGDGRGKVGYGIVVDGSYVQVYAREKTQMVDVYDYNLISTNLIQISQILEDTIQPSSFTTDFTMVDSGLIR